MERGAGRAARDAEKPPPRNEAKMKAPAGRLSLECDVCGTKSPEGCSAESPSIE